MLFSSSSALLPALPFAFFTPSLNYVASITLRKEPPPTGLQLTKWYFRPQVADMKSKLDSVRELGAATAEEWFKGLELDGKEKSADTARWEHWEFAGGFQMIAHNILQARHSQRPNIDPVSQHSITSEIKSSSCLGTAIISEFVSGKPAVNAQAHQFTNQGTHHSPRVEGTYESWCVPD